MKLLATLSLFSAVAVQAQDVIKGCNGATFLENPFNTELPGPSPVGYRRFVHQGINTAVWYPAELGSEAGKEQFELDIRQYLPPSQQDKIPDEKAPYMDSGCYEDLPIDDVRGPYPVIIFVHGTAAWKEQSMPQMVHWASRGFVVLSQDHPGLYLGDILAAVPLICPDRPTGSRNLEGDTDDLLAGLREGEIHATNMTFLQGNIDLDRIGLSGHSAGTAVDRWTKKPHIRAVVAMAGGTPTLESDTLDNVVKMGALDDDVVSFQSTSNSFDNSPAPKRLLGIKDQGHLIFSNICALKNDDGEGLVEIALNAGVCATQFATFLFDCDHSGDDQSGWDAINALSSAVWEESLQCQPIGGKLDTYLDRHRDVVEIYKEDLAFSATE